MILPKKEKMDTTEAIHNALDWANKRLELQGEALTENQKSYIVFALRINLAENNKKETENGQIHQTNNH